MQLVNVQKIWHVGTLLVFIAGIDGFTSTRVSLVQMYGIKTANIIRKKLLQAVYY